MNYSSIVPLSTSLSEMLARAALPYDVTFSQRLREHFKMGDNYSDLGWLDLIWAVRSTLSGNLPSRDYHCSAGRVQLSEYLSFRSGEAEPENRQIAVIHTGPASMHIVLPEEVLGRKRIVLVVEDDAHLAEITKLLINRLGVQTMLARDGLEGWQQVQQHLPAVVITDVDMPRIDGLQLCRQIKSDSRTQNIPVIVWSGDPSHEVTSRELGAVAFLPKPVDMQWLLGFLHDLLNP